MADTLIARLMDLFENLEADVTNLKQRVKILLERLRCTARLIGRHPRPGTTRLGNRRSIEPELALSLLWGVGD
jgi:hypothetical protein